MPTQPSTSSTPPWRAEIAARMRLHWAVKAIGITAWTWLFFIGYFHVLRNPAYPATPMPLTALDRLIPFEPLALFPYLTLWLYVGFAPALQASFRALVVYGLWIGALCITGLALFYFWPTAVPPRLMDVSGFAGFALLQGVDAPGNACPSMHVAVAIFSAICLDDVFRRVGAPMVLRLINLVWLVAIAYSTLATKQHVALDALAGALLGAAFALPSLRWRPAVRPVAADPQAAADIIGSH
jgi:hypothetical protein